MSVYGGFANRVQEGSYNNGLYKMLCLLQFKITRNYASGTRFSDI